MLTLQQEALVYHKTGRKGKVEVILIKPCAARRSISRSLTRPAWQSCAVVSRKILMTRTVIPPAATSWWCSRTNRITRPRRSRNAGRQTGIGRQRDSFQTVRRHIFSTLDRSIVLKKHDKKIFIGVKRNNFTSFFPYLRTKIAQFMKNISHIVL